MEQREISNTIFALMIGVALFYDFFQFLINLIPLAGQFLAFVVSIFAFLTFYVWFKLYGRSFMSPKRFSAMAVGVVIEMIPILNGLPGWTVAVILLVGIEKGVALLSKFTNLTKLIPGEGVIAAGSGALTKKVSSVQNKRES